MKHTMLINVVAAVAALVLPTALATIAVNQSVVRGLAADLNAAEDRSIYIYDLGNPTCLAWTDSCRICSRGADGQVACSNIGIACQPKPIVCSRHQEPKQEPPKQEPPKQEPPKQEPAPKQ